MATEAPPLETHVGNGILYLAWIPVEIGCTVWFWQRRHLHPITGRYPQLVLLLNAICVTMLISEGSAFFTEIYPCVIRQLAWLWLMPLELFIMIVRVYALVGNFENTKYIQSIGMAARTKYLTAAGLPATAAANQALVSGAITTPGLHGGGHRPSIHGHAISLGSGLNGETNQGGGMTANPNQSSNNGSGAAVIATASVPWIVNNRWLLRPSFPFRFGMVTSVALLVIWIIFVAALSPAGFTDACALPHVWVDNFAYTATIVPYIYIGPSLLSLIFAAWRLGRYEADNFKLKVELRIFFWLGFILLIVQAVEEATKPAWMDEWQIILLLGNLACFWTTTIYPLILTYWFQRQQRHAAVVIERVTKISDLMAFPAAMEVFTRYTQSEFCSELLFFIQRVDAYRKQIKKEARPPYVNSDLLANLVDQARIILEQYCEEGAPLEINISATERHAVQQRYLAIATVIQHAIEMRHTPTPILNGNSLALTGIPTAALPPPARSSSVSPMTAHRVPPSSTVNNNSPTASAAGHRYMTTPATPPPLLASGMVASSGHPTSNHTAVTILTGDESPQLTAMSPPAPNKSMTPTAIAATNSALIAASVAGSRAPPPSADDSNHGAGNGLMPLPPPSTTPTTAAAAAVTSVITAIAAATSSTPPLRARNANDVKVSEDDIKSLATIFDDSYTICVGLLTAGPWTRFQKSAVWRKFVSGLAAGDTTAQALHHALQTAQKPHTNTSTTTAPLGGGVLSGSGGAHATTTHGNTTMVSTNNHTMVSMVSQNGPLSPTHPITSKIVTPHHGAHHHQPVHGSLRATTSNANATPTNAAAAATTPTAAAAATGSMAAASPATIISILSRASPGGAPVATSVPMAARPRLISTHSSATESRSAMAAFETTNPVTTSHNGSGNGGGHSDGDNMLRSPPSVHNNNKFGNGNSNSNGDTTSLPGSVTQ